MGGGVGWGGGRQDAERCKSSTSGLVKILTHKATSHLKTVRIVSFKLSRDSGTITFSDRSPLYCQLRLSMTAVRQRFQDILFCTSLASEDF